MIDFSCFLAKKRRDGDASASQSGGDDARDHEKRPFGRHGMPLGRRSAALVMRLHHKGRAPSRETCHAVIRTILR